MISLAFCRGGGVGRGAGGVGLLMVIQTQGDILIFVPSQRGCVCLVVCVLLADLFAKS